MSDGHRLRELVREHLDGLDAVYVLDGIPARKLRNARTSHHLAKGEPILALFDDTLFGSATDGFVVTPERFSFKELLENPRSVRWAEVSPSDIDVGAKSIRIAGLTGKFTTWNAALERAVRAFLRAATAHHRPETTWTPTAITATVRQCLGEDTDVYLPPSIPPHKLANARERYHVPPGEPVLALFDDTVFGSAREGWVMTPRRWAFCGTFESPAEVAWTDLFTAERTCEENRVRVGRHVYTQLHARRTPALIGVFQRLQDLAGGTLEPRNPALDARITADPDDEAALAVYADWLLEQGHPRGFAATATGSALAELVAENGPELGTPDGTASVTWRWGFWDRVALFPTAPLADDADTAYHDARRVLRHPSARFVRSLAIGGADPLPPGLLEPVLRALSEVSLPCVERLAIAAGPRAFVSDTLDPRRFPRLREADLDVERVDPAVRGMLAGRLGR